MTELIQNNEEILYKQIRVEFKKSRKEVEEYIEILGRWAETQPHFPEKPSYKTLRFAVLYNKFSIERAKQKLDMYYTVRNLMPELFAMTPFTPEMLLQNKIWCLVPLPKVLDDHSRIIYHRLNPGYDDPKHFNHERTLVQLIHVMEILIEEDLSFNFHYVCDHSDLKLGHATKLSPMAVKKGTVILEKVFSNRMASFYMVNFPTFMETVVNNMLKPLLKPKIKKRLEVHSGTEALFQRFGKERLPKDIGGDEKSLKELQDMTFELIQNDEEKYKKQMQKEFNKSLKDMDEYIDILRKWAETQPHFPEKPSYKVLRFVLLYNKFSIEKAKQKLDMYYTVRNLMPEIFTVTPFAPEMAMQNKVWWLIPLPKIMDDHSRILYHRLNPEYTNPKYFVHERIIIQFTHLLEILIQEDLSSNFHYIFDCTGLIGGHSTNLRPMVIKKASTVLEKVFSNRMASFYMVNFPSWMETIANTLIKPLLNPKIRDRLQIHTGNEALFEKFGKDRLPKDIGGNEKPMVELQELFLQKYEKHKDRFMELSKMTVDESLRPEKLKNDDVLGYYGNFKKLNLIEMTFELIQNDEEKYKNYIKTEFNKSLEELDEYIDILGKWAETQPHLPEKPPYQILRFLLLYNKLSIEKAKQRLDMYYTVRNFMPEVFAVTPFVPDMVLQNKVWCLVPLPKVMDDHSRILYHRLIPEYADPKYFVHERVIIQFYHLIEILIEEDLSSKFHYIFDCKGLVAGHSTNIRPMVIKKASTIMEKVFSSRISSFYMINFPSWMETIANTIIKPMLNPKIRDRLQIQSGTEVLFEKFGKDRLPKDVGGNEKSAVELQELFVQKYEKHKERLLKLTSMTVDETVRPEKLINDDILGYYGNFKKLNLD
ncbi:uncharacterized protein LOC126740164 [Anthonomus grandis grandis]|uniref:uncharacterized protein LOC126740164 n=1 Tax=Anthonomus grandis grandis TaxID=2921223 RepID=UPI0021656D1D|nr:uncharacterized protein LOC126740164 [Anthonomus grandis grandis]